jgi:hypothetical protein
MKESKCGNCIIYSYLSYLSCFCCMIFYDLAKDCYKKWKNSASTRGFNNYDILPKTEEHIDIIETEQDTNTMENYIDFRHQEESTIMNLNESTATILKKWTIRPNISESINPHQNEPI